MDVEGRQASGFRFPAFPGARKPGALNPLHLCHGERAVAGAALTSRSVLPLPVPESASVLPAGDPDCTVKPNFPFTIPLKFPLSVKEPLSVSSDTKHGELVVKLKLETLSEPSPFTFKSKFRRRRRSDCHR